MVISLNKHRLNKSLSERRFTSTCKVKLYNRLGDYPILGFAVLLLVLGWIYRPRQVDVSFKSRR